LALIELLMLAAAGVLILFSLRKSSSLKPDSTFLTLERAFGGLARRKRLSVLVVGLSVIIIRVALIPVLGIPYPRFNDEFSYLLAADTFAHGRITNPTHPMWVHFESFHIIEKPTYMSMYPPAQGIVLAAGQIVGHPWIGQLFVTALMCSALCWMLQGWLPPPWALFGASLAVLRLGILSYWMNTYWCASIAALGGALVLGAWPRLRKHLQIRDALLMALGLAILANSRPYEGLVFALPVAAAMFLWLVGKDRPPLNRSIPRVIVPVALALGVAALATGYYYERVTGDPWRMAYQVNRDTYATAPYFIWQTPRPEPEYRHAVMRDFYRWELSEFKRNLTFTGYVQRVADKLISWWQFYLGPLLTIPLVAIFPIVRQRKVRLPLLILATMALGFSVQTWTLPHYFSPAMCALYLVLIEGLRYVAFWSPNRRPVGRALVRMIPVLACGMILLRIAAVLTHTNLEPRWPRGNLERAAVAAQLAQTPGKQLVLVSYEANHNVDAEWVWNSAEIDRSKVVWARDMGENANQELLNYFKDRRVWCVNGDTSPTQLEACGHSQ
jgi:hypothetical protein